MVFFASKKDEKGRERERRGWVCVGRLGLLRKGFLNMFFFIRRLA